MSTNRKRVKLVVAYDGTAYHGWQLQLGEITVEQVLNRAISDLTGENIQVIGASRTDAGVHAWGNVAVFDTVSRIPGEKFSYALNQRLPDDVVIQLSQEVSPDFHPRHCNSRKTYEYTILNRTFPLPEYRHTAYFYYGPLRVDEMRKAAGFFVGQHDFAAFCSAGTQVKSTVRKIYSLCVTQEPAGFIKIRVEGNGFLYNMVRIIAGTLIQVGQGRLEASAIPAIIASGDRGRAGATAPAHGLKLLGIEYE